MNSHDAQAVIREPNGSSEIRGRPARENQLSISE